MNIYLLAFISALFYRAGGMRGLNTKIRDLGCPTLYLLSWLQHPYPWWAHSLSFLLLFASLTTYWDSVVGEDNFYLHGFAIGLAYFPYAIVSGNWWGLIARSLILATFMGILNWWANRGKLPFSDWIEELLRGASIVLTFPLVY